MVKTLGEKVRISFAVLIAFFLMYGVAFGIINRIVGSNVIPGWGIRLDGDSTEVNALQCADSLMGIWDIDQSIAGEKIFSGDSVIVSTGGFRALNADFYGDVTIKGTSNLTVAGGTVSFPADEIGNTEVATIDSTWITDGSIGTSTIKDGGIFNPDLADDAVGNDECQAIDSTWITDGSIGTSSIKDGGVFAPDIATGAVGDDEIDYSAVTLDDFDYQTAWRVFYSNTDGDVTELAFGADGTYLKSNGASSAPTWATPPGGDPGAAIHDSIYANTPGYATNSEISDTLWAHLDDSLANYYTQTAVSVIAHDTLWANTPGYITAIDRFVESVNAIEFNVSDQMNLIYPVAYDNFDWVAIYTANTNDTKDTAIIFSFRMPMGADANGLDSIAFNARTTGAGVGDASIEVMVYKRTSDGAAKTAIDSLDEFNTAGAWAHQVITGFDTNASAGDWIRIEMIVNCDATDDSVFHDMAISWYTGG